MVNQIRSSGQQNLKVNRENACKILADRLFFVLDAIIKVKSIDEA